jgi:hypothetical protein
LKVSLTKFALRINQYRTSAADGRLTPFGNSSLNPQITVANAEQSDAREELQVKNHGNKEVNSSHELSYCLNSIVRRTVPFSCERRDFQIHLAPIVCCNG